ncbi:MAG: hypothetical protein ABL995_16670 [Bryobacteraceae bacterium]
MRATNSMETINDGRPSVCAEAGLACETCVSATARQLAGVCKGLKGKMIGQLFVQLYTEPACARMHGAFAEAYREAETELAEIGEPKVAAPVNYGYERREVGSARSRVMAACA